MTQDTFSIPEYQYLKSSIPSSNQNESNKYLAATFRDAIKWSRNIFLALKPASREIAKGST